MVGRKTDLIPWATVLKGTMEFPGVLPQTPSRSDKKKQWDNVAAPSL